MERLSDYIMQEEAEYRMEHFDQKETMAHDEVMKSLDITEDDLANVDVEIE